RVCSISVRLPRSRFNHSSWAGSKPSPAPLVISECSAAASSWSENSACSGTGSPATGGSVPSLARSSSGFRSNSSSTKAERSRLDSCSSLIACISCGVITSDCDWRNSNLCVSAMEARTDPKSWSDSCLNYSKADVYGLTNEKKGLQAEFLAKVKAPDIWIVDDFVRIALRHDLAG